MGSGALGCSTPAIVCGKRPVYRSHASLLPRCCLGSSSPALVCDSSPPAAKESNPCRLCGPLAAPVLLTSRREFLSSNSAATSRESSERRHNRSSTRPRTLAFLAARAGARSVCLVPTRACPSKSVRRRSVVGFEVARRGRARRALRRRAMSARVTTIPVSVDRPSEPGWPRLRVSRVKINSGLYFARRLIREFGSFAAASETHRSKLAAELRTCT